MCQINAGNGICYFEHLFLCFRPAGVEYMQPFFHVCETYKKKIMNLRQLQLLMYSNDKLIIKFLIKALTVIFKNGLLIYYSNYPWFHISTYQLDI